VSFALTVATLVDSIAVGVEDVVSVCFELPNVVCDMKFNVNWGEDNEGTKLLSSLLMMVKQPNEYPAGQGPRSPHSAEFRR